MGRDDDTTTERGRPSEPGYVVAPARLGHRSYRRWSVVGLGVAVIMAAAVAKPWDRPAGIPAEGAVAPSPVAALGGTASPTVPPDPSASVPPETWPVGIGVTPLRRPNTVDASARTVLVTHAGTWGVAAVGNGPRFVRDEPWVDWAAVVPEATSQAADRIATWPGTGICTGIPVLLDRPTAIGVSTSIDLGADPPIEAWWSDGGRTAALEGSIRELYALGDGGLTVLERLDGSAWPAGRYEFHVGRGDRILALVVCLAGSG